MGIFYELQTMRLLFSTGDHCQDVPLDSEQDWKHLNLLIAAESISDQRTAPDRLEKELNSLGRSRPSGSTTEL